MSIGGSSQDRIPSSRDMVADPERKMLRAGDCVTGREGEIEFAVDSILSFCSLNATLSGRVFSDEEVLGSVPCDECWGEDFILLETGPIMI